MERPCPRTAHSPGYVAGSAEPPTSQVPTKSLVSLGLCAGRWGWVRGREQRWAVSLSLSRGWDLPPGGCGQGGETPKAGGAGKSRHLADICNGPQSSACSSHLGPQDPVGMIWTRRPPSDLDVLHLSGKLPGGRMRLLWRQPLPKVSHSLPHSIWLLSLSQTGYWI